MREGWKKVKLRDVLTIKHGFAFKGEYFTEEKSRNLLLTPGNFAIGGGYKSDKLKYYDGPVPEDYILSPGDILVTMTDLSKQADTLGYSAKIPRVRENIYLHNQRLGLVSIKNNAVDSDFMYWLLRTEHYQRFVAGSATGSTVKHTSPKKIYFFETWIPDSKETQRKIASILSAYDDLIDNNLKRIKLLEEMAQLTYEEWFVRMKFPGHENVKMDKETGLPEGWEKKPLGSFVKTGSGGTPSRKKIDEYYTGGNIPWIKTGELRSFLLIESSEKITPKGLKNSSAKLFPSGTVLLAMYGNTIGESSYLSFEAATNQACCAFLVGEERYRSYFIHQLLRYSKEYILRFRMGAAQENISQQIIKAIKVVVPTENLLQRFGETVSPIYSEIINLHRQNQLLQEARDILLPRLMTGMVDPSTLLGTGVEELLGKEPKVYAEMEEEKLGMVAEVKPQYESNIQN